jgi:hypothetical protein
LPTEKPVWSKVNEYPKEWDEVITQAPSAYSVDDQIPF